MAFMNLVFGLLGLISMSIQSPQIIKGYVSEYASDRITLFKVEDGGLSRVMTHEIDSDSLFSFYLSKEVSGFYYLASNEDSKSIFGRFYVAKGQQADLKIIGKQIDRNSYPDLEKYQYEEEWGKKLRQIVSDNQKHGRIKEDVTGLLNRSEEAYLGFLKSIHTADSRFNELMKLAVRIDFELFWLRTSSMASQEIFEVMEQHPLFRRIAGYDLSTAELLQDRNGTLWLGARSTLMARLHKEQIPDFLAFCLDLCKNDTLKGQIFKDHLIKPKVSGKHYHKRMASYGKYLVTERQKEEIAAYEKIILKFDEGVPAIDFSYPDTSGKQHALSDYKGKVVLVDVWATWCAPCKAEIPHFEKLIEQYNENPEVVFMGVSIDKQSDKAKWEAFVKEHDLKGIQMLADKAFKSKILLDYEITGVPRFMLFDQEGKIVSVNAPRPSSPLLKEMIDEQLKN